MKKIIWIGATLIVLGLMAAWTIPVLAHGSGSGTTTPTNTPNDTAWEDMYQACQNGDWEAMEEAAGQVHSEDYGNMPCYDDYNGTTEDYGNMPCYDDYNGTTDENGNMPYHEDYSSNPDENGGTSGESWNEMDNHNGGGMMGGGMMGW